MERRQRIFIYGVILGLIMFGFIFWAMTARFKSEGNVPGGIVGRQF